jgi:hypothetical protein
MAVRKVINDSSEIAALKVPLGPHVVDVPDELIIAAAKWFWHQTPWHKSHARTASLTDHPKA